MEHVHQKNVEKVSKWLEKGLDPNFHDSDTGGEHFYTNTRTSRGPNLFVTRINAPPPQSVL